MRKARSLGTPDLVASLQRAVTPLHFGHLREHP